MTTPSFTNWQEAWEYEAQQNAQTFTNFSNEQLLAYIQQGFSDPFFVVWQEIGSRKKPEIFADALRAVIADIKRPKLDRHHAEQALIATMQE
jgi:hypothetical protein